MPGHNIPGGNRDWGYDETPRPEGRPVWRRMPDAFCPNCGAALCEILVRMPLPQLKGGMGLGRYLGCPACQFASPMITRAMSEREIDRVMKEHEQK